MGKQNESKMKLFIFLLLLAFCSCEHDEQTAANETCKAAYFIRETRNMDFTPIRTDTLQKDCRVCGADIQTFNLRRDTGYLPTTILIQYTALGSPCR